MRADQRVIDDAREARIGELAARIDAADTAEARAILFRQMRDEIRQRSIEQVCRMEAEKGLNR
ncbi:hypothetical protein BZM27_05855 [Paraburkholderia steynii]|uniref:Uncharacterized protein n=1 Tax=Paraburkholderia steynii TaxID=1245441 RepID=A0A4R0XG93_9BURK|nr:hypothetical protein BZM27_05855 [Paraburkholderia steynii]